jgi:hypothetical protein
MILNLSCLSNKSKIRGKHVKMDAGAEKQTDWNGSDEQLHGMTIKRQ